MQAILASATTLFQADHPDPSPGPHDLLVRVEAVAVNPLDGKQRAGIGANDPPRILGWDFAGRVEAVGAAVAGFSPGDPVMGSGDSLEQGCFAELVRIEAALVGPQPAGLGAAAAAALPLTGLTAWESLFERLGLDPDGGDAGRSLLILGGAGGVGSMAIQLARRAGLVVIATASRPESAAWVKDLGANHVVDHHQPLAPQLAALGHPTVQHIFNTADTLTYWDTMAELIAPQGSIVALVSCGGPVALDALKAKSASFHWEFMLTRPLQRTADRHRQGAILRRLAQLVEAGELRSTAQTVLTPISPAQLEQALARISSGRTIGKTVLAGWD